MASFGDAFKAARSAGKTTFKWQGKSYHTKTKDEMTKTKKAVPTPTSRPEPAVAKGGDSMVPRKYPDTDTSSAPSREKQDYPRPAKSLGIARAGSGLSKIAARRENAPVDDKPKTRVGRYSNRK